MIENFKNGIKSITFERNQKTKETIKLDKGATWLFSIDGFEDGVINFKHIMDGESIVVNVHYDGKKYKEIPSIVFSHFGSWIISYDGNDYIFDVLESDYAIADIKAISRVKARETRVLSSDEETKATLLRLSREIELLKVHIRTLEYELKERKK